MDSCLTRESVIGTALFLFIRLRCFNGSNVGSISALSLHTWGVPPVGCSATGVSVSRVSGVKSRGVGSGHYVRGAMGQGGSSCSRFSLILFLRMRCNVGYFDVFVAWTMLSRVNVFGMIGTVGTPYVDLLMPLCLFVHACLF